jgi:threonine dehydrogenase-like Zn-dependent dehydrogenase
VPLADGTVVKAPDDIKDEVLVLMADIFPTGYFAASNGLGQLTEKQRTEATVVVIGCGPVGEWAQDRRRGDHTRQTRARLLRWPNSLLLGLCTVIAASTYKPKHLFAVDSVPSRLELARSLGAEPLNFETDREGLGARIKDVTEGRGADVVLEVVGLGAALRLGFDILRPWGIMSSVGVHNGEVCVCACVIDLFVIPLRGITTA